jgi:hypothetical protein
MSDLVEFRNIADEIEIRDDGVAVVGIRGAGRLAGVRHTNLIRHFKGGALEADESAESFTEQGVEGGALDGNLNRSKLAQMLMDKGFDGGKLKSFAKEGVPDQALGVILKYYAYKAEPRWRTEQAEYACDQFIDIGIRATCYAVKGLDYINPAPKELPEKPVPRPTFDIIDGGSALLGSAFGKPYREKTILLNMRRYYPEVLIPEIAAVDRSSLKSAEALLTPTQIAAEMNILCKTTPNPSGAKVNTLLEQHGYQINLGKGKWSATDKGEPFSERKPVDLKKKKADKDQLLWYASIIDELRPLVDDQPMAA